MARRICIALFTLLAACSGDKQLADDCKASDECAANLTCDGGKCRGACNVPADCTSGTTCERGLCLPLHTGTCAVASDCTTPPDGCYITTGARCISGVCDYPRNPAARCRETCTSPTTCTTPVACETVAGTACIDGGCAYGKLPDGEACITDTKEGLCYDGACVDCINNSDCDPRDFGRDLCFAGTCLERTCSFAPIPTCQRTDLGTTCEGNENCKSGFCADGVCCENACEGLCKECSSAGRCDATPQDDADCGLIDCDQLDSDCRNYGDYDNSYGRRCADFGQCRVANDPDDCQRFTNANSSIVCRPSENVCDAVERCDGMGSCPDDLAIDAGDPCLDLVSEDRGRCDADAVCLQLSSTGPSVRYFNEEVTTSNRLDAFGAFDLTAAAVSSEVDLITSSTGKGLSWDTATSLPTYCRVVGGTEFEGTFGQLTLEADVLVDNSLQDDQWVFGVGSDTLNDFGLSVTRTSGTAAGHAIVSGWFAGLEQQWSITTTSRTILHLVLDTPNTTAGNRLRLYVNGELAAVSVAVSIALNAEADFAATDSMCLGNDVTAPHSAFSSTIFYTAMYQGVLDAAAIREAAGRLAFSDAP